MANASSIFLRNANTVNGAAPAQPPSDSEVLSAADSPDVTDVAALATRLQAVPSAVGQVVDRLASRGFLQVTNTNITLSDAGRRALSYASIAKF